MTDKDQSSAAGQHGHSTSRGLAIKRVGKEGVTLLSIIYASTLIKGHH